MIRRIGNGRCYAEVTSKGATVQQFVLDNVNLIYPQRLIDGKLRGGIPICFPVFGKPTDLFASMPQHGWLRDQELELVAETENSVTFLGTNEVSAVYPWQLKYAITVELNPKEESLAVRLETQRLENREWKRLAPVNQGFHPYFCSQPWPICSGEVMWNGLGNKRFGSTADITSWDRSSAILYPADLRLQMTCSDCCNPATQMVFWSDRPSEYFCVEPVLRHPYTFGRHGSGKFLQEGQKLEMVFKLSVL